MVQRSDWWLGCLHLMVQRSDWWLGCLHLKSFFSLKVILVMVAEGRFQHHSCSSALQATEWWRFFFQYCRQSLTCLQPLRCHHSLFMSQTFYTSLTWNVNGGLLTVTSFMLNSLTCTTYSQSTGREREITAYWNYASPGRNLFKINYKTESLKAYLVPKILPFT